MLPRTKEDLLYLVLRFLNQNNLSTISMLLEEKLQERTPFFNNDRFENMVRHQRWREAEEYVAKFTRSIIEQLAMVPVIYEMKKIKYFEAVIKPDPNEAQRILDEEIFTLDWSKEDIQADIAQLHETARDLDTASASEDDIQSIRSDLLIYLRQLLHESPFLPNYSQLEESSLLDLLDRSRRFDLAKLIINGQGSATRKRSENYLASASRSHSHLYPGRLYGDGDFENANPRLIMEESVGMLLLTLPANPIMAKQQILRLTYMNSGTALLALVSNGFHPVWKWPQLGVNPSGKATAWLPAQLVRPEPIQFMINDRMLHAEKYISCFALSNDDSFLLSASGGKLSRFNTTTFKATEKYMTPPPAATALALHPDDNNIIAVGKDDFTIEIFNLVAADQVNVKLEGHTKRITGLAFSQTLNSLVSSGADAQIFVWSIHDWKKKVQTSLVIPSTRPVAAMSKTEVQFHVDGIRLLVVHETQLAIYEAETLQCKNLQWIVDPFLAPINSATFSCDSKLIYCSFLDGTLRIFRPAADSLQVLHRIRGSAYIASFDSFKRYRHPTVVAAHPHDPNQFAVGLTDGQVYVIQPLSFEDRWDNRKALGKAQASSDLPSTSGHAL